MKKIKYQKVLISLLLVVAMLMTVGIVQAGENNSTIIELESTQWSKSDDSIWWETPYSHGAFPAGVGALMNTKLQNTTNTVSTKINVAKSGDYTVKLAYLKETDGAQIELAIDGVVFDVIADTYNAGGWQAGATVMGVANLATGEHTLTFRAVSEGKDRMMLDYLELTPISNTFVYELESTEWSKSDDSIWWETPYSHGAFPAGVGALMNTKLQNTINTVSTKINVAKSGDYTVKLAYLKETDGAQIELAIDGVVFDVIADTYNAGGWQAGATVMGVANLATGEHTLTFRAVSEGKDRMMLDYLELEMIDDDFIYEFEGNNYAKSDDAIWLENNYSHSALPVPGVVFSELKAVGGYIETESLIVPKDGKYKVVLGYIADKDHDTVQISIDGIAVGEAANTYHAGNWTAMSKDLGEIDLTAGIHKITITAVSGNSGKFATRLDYLSFERVGDITPDEPDTPINPDEPGVTDPETGDVMISTLVAVMAVSVFGVLFVYRRKLYE